MILIGFGQWYYLFVKKRKKKFFQLSDAKKKVYVLWFSIPEAYVTFLQTPPQIKSTNNIVSKQKYECLLTSEASLFCWSTRKDSPSG